MAKQHIEVIVACGAVALLLVLLLVYVAFWKVNNIIFQTAWKIH
jgi:hypothetical protein